MAVRRFCTFCERPRLLSTIFGANSTWILGCGSAISQRCGYETSYPVSAFWCVTKRLRIHGVVLVQKILCVCFCLSIPAVMGCDNCRLWCVVRSLRVAFAPSVEKRAANNEQFNNKEKVGGYDNIGLHSVQP